MNLSVAGGAKQRRRPMIAAPGPGDQMMNREPLDVSFAQFADTGIRAGAPAMSVARVLGMKQRGAICVGGRSPGPASGTGAGGTISHG